jgi:lipopolysaccharide export system protein LptA
MIRILARVLALVLVLSGPAAAQQASVAFGGLRQDTSLPVEIAAESLSVDNTTGLATFTGNVVIAQGEMRLSAATVRVEYDTGGQSIRRLVASGGVTLAAAGEAAEAAEAIYTIDSGLVEMSGDVLLTQGASALAGERLTIDLRAGTGQMSGGVRTTFVPGGN